MDNFIKKYQNWEQGKWSNIIYIAYSSVAIAISLIILLNIKKFATSGLGNLFGKTPALVIIIKFFSALISIGSVYFALELFGIKENRKSYRHWLKFLGSLCFGLVFFSIMNIGSKASIMNFFSEIKVSFLFGDVTKQQVATIVGMVQKLFSFLAFTISGLFFTVLFYVEMYRNSNGTYTLIAKEGTTVRMSIPTDVGPQKSFKEVWSHQPKALKRGLFGGAAVLVLLLVGVGAYRYWDTNLNFTTIDSQSMFYVKFNGLDGQGTASVLRTNYELVEIGMYQEIYNETSEGEKKIIKTDQVISPATKEKYQKQYDFFTTLAISQSQGSLTNGDDYEIQITYDKEEAKKNKIKFSSDTVSFKVSGLTKIAQSIDEVEDIDTLTQAMDTYVSTLDIKPEIAGQVAFEGIYINDPALRSETTATKTDTLSIAYVYHVTGEQKGIFSSTSPVDEYNIFWVRTVTLDEEGKIVLPKTMKDIVTSSEVSFGQYSSYESLDDYMVRYLKMKKTGGAQ